MLFNRDYAMLLRTGKTITKHQVRNYYFSGWVIFWCAVLALGFLIVLFPLIQKKAGASEVHFSKLELECYCCGVCKITPQLMVALEKLRARVGVPIIVTSGYRCPKHNRGVGGAKHSQHILGNAVDIKIKGYTPAQVARLARGCGFTWTKTYSSWTHVDIRPIQLAKARVR